MGAIIRGRRTCSTWQSFNLTYHEPTTCRHGYIADHGTCTYHRVICFKFVKYCLAMPRFQLLKSLFFNWNLFFNSTMYSWIDNNEYFKWKLNIFPCSQNLNIFCSVQYNFPVFKQKTKTLNRSSKHWKSLTVWPKSRITISNNYVDPKLCNSLLSKWFHNFS